MGIVNKVIGVCRFSYLGESGFQLLKGGPEEAARQLYAPWRMERRFAYFENICLPSLAAQTDKDFRLVALIGKSMPGQWRRRLRALKEAHTFLEICAIDPVGPLQASRRAFRKGLSEPTDFVTGFRIDDDDAVAVDFIAKTRTVADNLLSLEWATNETPAVIAFQKGLYWDMLDRNPQFAVHTESAPLGQASAMVAPYDDQRNIYRWNHRHLRSKAKVWSDPTDTMFVRGLHDTNDSTRTLPKTAQFLGVPAASKIMRERFGLAPQRIIPLMKSLHSSAVGGDGPGAG